MSDKETIKSVATFTKEQWSWIALGGIVVLILLGALGTMPSHLYWGKTVPIALAIVLVVVIGYSVFQEEDTMVPKFAAVLLLIFTACIYVALPNSFLSIIGDNVRFIGGAVGIQQGKGYLDVWRDPPVYQLSYGVGMPLLLQPSLWLFPDNIVALKMPIALSGIAGVGATYVLFKQFKGLPVWLALIIALLVSVNAFLVGSMDQVMSEIPYYAASVVALFAIIKYSRDEKQWGVSFVFAALSIAWCYYVRSNGASLLLAAIMALGLKKQWRKVLLLGGATLMLIMPWQVRNKIIGKKMEASGMAYPSQFSQFIDYFTGSRGDEAGYATQGKSVHENIKFIIRKGLHDQWKWSTEILFRRGDTAWKIMGLAVLLLGLIVHMYQSWFRHREELAMDFYVGGAFILNLFLGAVVATRYVFVLAPFIIYYWLYGCLFLWRLLERASTIKYKQYIGRSLIFAIALAMFYPQLISAMQTVQYKRLQRGYGGAWGAFYNEVQWVGKNTKSMTKLVTRKPQMVYPWIKRQAECYPFTTNQDSMLTYLTNHDFIIIDAGMGFTSTQKYVAPVISKHMGTHFRVVHRSQPMYYGKRPFYQYVIQTIRKK